MTSDKLYQQQANSKIELEKSFSCNSAQNLTFTKVDDISTILSVSQLQVQAFQFKNSTSGQFDERNSSIILISSSWFNLILSFPAIKCLLDTGSLGNWNYTIAVGAALAGLVVIVIIVCIIRRTRSQRSRHKEYESISEPIA